MTTLAELMMKLRVHAELADVFAAIAELCAARGNPIGTAKALSTIEAVAPPGLLPSIMATSGGTWINMLAEGTGRPREEIVRGALAQRHDEGDMALFDALLLAVDTGVDLDLRALLKDDGA